MNNFTDGAVVHPPKLLLFFLFSVPFFGVKYKKETVSERKSLMLSQPMSTKRAQSEHGRRLREKSSTGLKQYLETKKLSKDELVYVIKYCEVGGIMCVILYKHLLSNAD
jgi:hypothetical protein